MTHEQNIAELLGTVVQPNNNSLVEDVLGIGTSEPSPSEIAAIQEKEREIEQIEAAALVPKKEIVLDLGVEPPFLFAYWDGMKWKVEIKDGEGPRFLDPRERNLLHR